MEVITLNDLFNAGFEQNKGLILKIFNSDKNKYFFDACATGKLELVQFMVENGANIQKDKNLPVQLASREGHLEVVKYLIQKGAEVTDDDDLALRQASRRGHLEIVKFLIEEHAADVKACSNEAIREASEYGHLEVVKLLIQWGADVKAVNNCSIREASKNGHLEVVKVLLAPEHGVEITDEIINNAKDNVKEYLKVIKNAIYFGFVSKDKLDIKLPDLLEINKNNQYYYVYKSSYNQEDNSYSMKDFLNKQKILLSLTNNNVDSLRTYLKI